MQLVAYGAQDIYLTGNPQITFFKVVYRRHTNFAMESVEQTFSGSATANGRAVATVARNGDLVGRMYVEWVAGNATDTNDDNYGSSVFNNVSVDIGGQEIDKHTGLWMETWAQLTENNPAGANPAGSAGMTDNNPTLYQKMAHSGGTAGHATAPGYLSVPLQFWFNRNPGLALPLIALQYHEVKVTINFSAHLVSGSLTTTPSLWADYIYLDTDERRRFAQVSHEYLIEQVQEASFGSSAASMDLTFNHPVKELVWCGPPGADGPTTPTTLTAANYKLKLNGHDRMAARDVKYFTRTQVWQHHNGYGGVNNTDSIAVYSFALKPEEHQPSGTCNFSRIDNAQLVQSGGDATGHEVFAVNYNVLRVMSGMGGLAYSN